MDLGPLGAFLTEGTVTDNSFPDNLNPDADDLELSEVVPELAKDEDDYVEAIFIGPRRRTSTDPYDLGELFLGWAWGSGYRDWNTGVLALARALRGLAEAGLIERRTVRRRSGPTHHGFVLTEDGQEALRALSGDWITDARVE